VIVSKVFPHNLRHLFARTFYSLEKDIVRLSDILGHSSINTTRIYTAESGEEHCRQMQKLGLLCSTALFDRGVTTIRYGDGYGSLMVLGSNLKPYTKKIILK